MFEEIWIEENYLPPGWESGPGATVVDVGANVGLFSVWAARRLGATRLVAIEPAPDTVAALRANLERNGVQAAVVEAGVAAASGRATLHRRGAPALDTTFTSDLYGSRFEPTASVELVTLDEIFSQFRIERCDLLKLDCEGGEYDALAGASRDTLARISNVVAEYHVGLDERRPELLAELLERHGFDVDLLPQIDIEGGHLRATRRH
jgi:FkbM family methyltransferase